MVAEQEILTPDQAASYLQVTRETIYQYIRDGRLLASRLGRSYRIPRENVELFLGATRTRTDIVLRDYTAAEIAGFLVDDQLQGEAAKLVLQFNANLEQDAVLQ